MPLLEAGEIEFGIINILDANMAATGTVNGSRAVCMKTVRCGTWKFNDES